MSVWSKIYERINWKDLPQRLTALAARNLNKMDLAIDTIDDRVIALDSDKVSKEEGKGLSSNDYTTAEKTKLAGIATGATAVSISDTLQDGDTIATITVDGTPTAIKAKQPNESEMNVRSAMLLLSTTSIGENAPFVKRRSGGNVSFPALLKDKIIGASVVWNQLVKNGNFANGTNNWNKNGTASWTVTSGVLEFTASTSTDNNRIYQQLPILTNHVVFVSLKAKSSVSTSNFTAGIRNNTNVGGNVYTVGTTEQTIQFLFKATGDNPNIVIGNNARDEVTLYIDDIFVTDITTLFSNSIVDYVYSLEQTETGSGIAWLKSYGFFTEPYYAYSANKIESVSVSAKKYTGKNRVFGKLTNKRIDTNGKIETYSGLDLYIADVVAGLTYTVSGINDSNGIYAFYNTIPTAVGDQSYNKSRVVISGATTGFSLTSPIDGYVAFRSDNTVTDIQCEIGSVATSYESYKEWQTALDHTTLRGFFKLDANNNLYADGDIYPSNGTESVVMGEIDLGDYTWTYDSSNQRFYTNVNDIKREESRLVQMLCPLYECKCNGETFDATWDMVVYNWGGNYKTRVAIHNHTYTDATTFKTAMSGVKLMYPLETKTTQTLTPYSELQNIASGGTEEFIDYGVEQGTRDVSIPVGGERQYYQGMDLPALPTASGNHNLQFNPSSGFSWS